MGWSEEISKEEPKEVSNSAKAKERRSKRGRATKHQRTVMATQHFGDNTSVKRPEATGTKSIPGGLSAIEKKMAEMRSRL